MESGRKVITRRDFIRVGSCLTMGSLMGLWCLYEIKTFLIAEGN
jgi:hypothetical protein